jgi:hypothetical protein
LSVSSKLCLFIRLFVRLCLFGRSFVHSFIRSFDHP